MKPPTSLCRMKSSSLNRRCTYHCPVQASATAVVVAQSNSQTAFMRRNGSGPERASAAAAIQLTTTYAPARSAQLAGCRTPTRARITVGTDPILERVNDRGPVAIGGRSEEHTSEL